MEYLKQIWCTISEKFIREVDAVHIYKDMGISVLEKKMILLVCFDYFWR